MQSKNQKVIEVKTPEEIQNLREACLIGIDEYLKLSLRLNFR